MNILKVIPGFVPFALFSFTANTLGVGWAALAGFLAALIVVWATRAAGVQSLPILQAGVLFVMALCGFLGGPTLREAVGNYGPAIAAILMGAYMIATAWHRPFTAETARASVPQSLWHDPRFIAVNTKISAAWGLAVLVLGLSPLAAKALAGDGSAFLQVTLLWVIPFAAVVAAVSYTKRTAAAAHARVAAAHLAAKGTMA